MPDQEGKLTPAEKEKLEAWFRKNWKQDYKCPICDSVNWVSSEHVVETKIFRGGNLFIGGPTYLYIPITSIPCGYTVFLNATVMNILDLPQISPPSPKEDEKNG